MKNLTLLIVGVLSTLLVFGQENHAPVVTVPDAITLTEGFGSETIDISQYFSDPDGDELYYYAVLNNEENFVSVSVDIDGSLTITENNLGSGYLGVSASDEYGEMVYFNIPISVMTQGNVAPVVTNTLNIMPVTETGRVEIDLSAYFSDDDDLTYEIYWTDNQQMGLDSIDITDNILSFDVVREGIMGLIDVMAYDGNGGEALTTFAVLLNAEGNTAPTASQIDPVILTLDSPETEIDLSNYFSDAETTDLMYFIVEDDVNIAEFEEIAGILTIQGMSLGSTVVTIFAYDLNGGVNQVFFTVEYAEELPTAIAEVKPTVESVKVYPTVANAFVTVEAPISSDIIITNIAGEVVIEITSVEEKTVVNIDALSAGFYMVHVGDTVNKIIKK